MRPSLPVQDACHVLALCYRYDASFSYSPSPPLLLLASSAVACGPPRTQQRRRGAGCGDSSAHASEEGGGGMPQAATAAAPEPPCRCPPAAAPCRCPLPLPPAAAPVPLPPCHRLLVAASLPPPPCCFPPCRPPRCLCPVPCPLSRLREPPSLRGSPQLLDTGPRKPPRRPPARLRSQECRPRREARGPFSSGVAVGVAHGTLCLGVGATLDRTSSVSELPPKDLPSRRGHFKGGPVQRACVWVPGCLPTVSSHNFDSNKI